MGLAMRKELTIHMVICDESWQEADEKGGIVDNYSRHVWISDLPFCRKKVHKRCNLGGRHRWQIEEAILVEKRHGYN